MKEPRQWILEQIPPGSGILCAVSGGQDSMVLLHFLRDCGYAVSAAHLHHGIRGETADRDQKFVRDYCKEHDIPFVTSHVDVPAMAAENGQSLEEAARNARNDFLLTAALTRGVTCIATGHQLEDQAETILLNLTRGTGADGLRGIARRKGYYIRPFLTVGREEIAAYAQEHQIPSVEDETNQNLIYSRNRIRHKVVPQLMEINPSVCETISRTAQIIAEESHLLDRLVVGMFPARETVDGLAIDFAAFQEAEIPLRRRVVRMLIGRMPVGRKDFSAVHFDAVAHMKRGDCLILPKNVFAAVEKDELLIGVMRVSHQAVSLRENEPVEWEDWIFEGRLEDGAVPDRDTVVLDPHGLHLPLIIGPWRSGDRMADGRGERTMKRLFADARVPVYRRFMVPVVYNSKKPVAAFGVATSEAHLPHPGQKQFVIRRYLIEEREKES